MKIKSIVLLVACFLSFSSCDTITQLASFVNCKYEFTGLSNPAVAGISLNNIQNVNSLNAASLLKLAAGVMSGSLPLTTTVNVKATNPNSTAAQIAGLDWALDMNSSSILTGTVNNQVNVPANGGQTNIPFIVQMDLMQMFKGESKDNILQFVNNLLNLGKSSSNLSLRIKPTVMIAGQKLSTGFVTLK
jgi:LEA14-like dessication related protein